MKALCKKAGVNPSKVFPHNLRKLFARTFYDIEKDIAKLADILGHSNINTTRIYIMTYRGRAPSKNRKPWAGVLDWIISAVFLYDISKHHQQYVANEKKDGSCHPK